MLFIFIRMHSIKFEEFFKVNEMKYSSKLMKHKNEMVIQTVFVLKIRVILQLLLQNELPTPIIYNIMETTLKIYLYSSTT